MGENYNTWWYRNGEAVKAVFALVVVVGGFLCFVSLLLWIGAQGGREVGIGEIRKEAIERGFAEFNRKTGEWQWKEPTP